MKRLALLLSLAACGGEMEKPAPPPPARPEYRVEVKRHGEGRVQSTPPGIDCGPVCEARFPEETQVTLTGRSTVTSSCFGWAGGGCKNGPGACSFTLGEPTTVQAFFPRTREPRWQVRVGGEGSEIARDVAIDAEGNAWLLFATRRETDEHAVLSLRGFDGVGAPLPEWKVADTDDDASLGAAVAAGADTIYVAGATLPDHRPFLASLAPDGALRWNVSLAGKRRDGAFAVAVTSDGGAVVGGGGFVAAFTPAGKQRWAREAPGVEIRAVATSGKLIAVAGVIRAASSFGGKGVEPGGPPVSTFRGVADPNAKAPAADAFVALLDDRGRVKWARRYGGDAHDAAMGVAFVGNDLAAGGAQDDGVPFVALLDAGGAPRWWKPWVARAQTGFVADLVYAADGRLHATGSFSRAVTFGSLHLAAEDEDGFLIAYSLEGEVASAQRIGSSRAAAPGQVAALATGGVVVAGTFDERFDLAGGAQTSEGETDVLVARLAP